MSRGAGMSSHDPANMQTSQSYPSPTAVPISDPFFTHQQRLSPTNEAQLAAQLSRSHALMGGPMNGGGAGEMSSAHLGQDVRRASDIDPETQLDSSPGDPNAPRKRSKVSRACDECRRKKIRCDATSESGLDQCTSCKRTGVHCQFSRVPMKRGPSKGYIKELADRLITLENSMMTPGQSNEIPYAQMEETSPRADDYSPQPAQTRSSRKRTHSATEFQSPGYPHSLSQRPSLGGQGWPPQDPSRQLPLPASGHPPHAQYSPNGTYQPQLRSTLAEAGARESINMPYEPADPEHVDVAFDWDEQAIEGYYQMVHPVLPLLPTTKARLRARLSRCPATLREAFLEALYALVRGLPSLQASSMSDRQDTRKANDLIAASQFDQMASRSPSINLVYLQAMLLMTLEADNHGPAAMQRQLGPPRSVWLSSAVGLAYFLRLHIGPGRERLASDDLDPDERLGRRIWWILVTLDRWHALSTASPVLIPDSVVTLMPGDQHLLGDHIYQLARISIVYGHAAEVCLNEDSASPQSGPLLGRLLAGELDRFRESVDGQLGALPVVHLAYWHGMSLVKRFTSPSNALELLEPAQQIASLLGSTSAPVALLGHHFTALAGLTLNELSDVADTKDAAWKSLHDLHETLNRTLAAAASTDEPSSSPSQSVTGWDVAVRDLITRKLQHPTSSSSSGTATSTSAPPNQGGLQRLADLAVGERGDKQPSSKTRAGAAPSGTAEDSAAAATTSTEQVLDPLHLTRQGYLNVVAEEWGRGR